MFKEILKKLRAEKGITQQDVADYLNIKRPTYTRYESGTNEPDLQTIAKLAQFFDVSVDNLIGYNSKKEKPIEKIDGSKKTPRRRFLEEELKDVKFAFAGDDGDYSDDDLESIYEFALFIKEKNKKREQEKKQQENKKQ